MVTCYYTASSLDGYIADPDHSLDWLFQFDVPDNWADYERFFAGVGALAMGSTTYEWILRHHVHADPPEPWPYAIPCWIFSSRDQPTLEGADLRFVRGDVRPVHGAMREAAGERDVWLVGGGDLVGQFLDADLLDEIRVGLAPVLLGSGAPLLPRTRTWPAFELVEASNYGGVFAALTYRVPRAHDRLGRDS